MQVASFHGTSTTANDKNESDVVNQQMEHLGRAAGNPVFVVAQKWLTGHPKVCKTAAAAAAAAAARQGKGGLSCVSNSAFLP